MCNFCKNYENVCLMCGSVLGEDYKGIFPFVSLRRDLKNIVGTCEEDTFVWLLVFRENVVKVGCGTLRKLYNETLPNPKYCRFDKCIIYYVNNKWDRNELATLLCGLYSDTVVNRQGWSNYTYCKSSDLIMPANESNPMIAFGDAEFYIGDTPYWDIRKLRNMGIQRRNMRI